MSRKLQSFCVVAALVSGPVYADVPNVAVDIAPVHSLVARVMAGVGSPSLIMPAGASPHEYSLRPSEAAALQSADVVVWMGPDLAPFMEGAAETLTDGASILTLLEAEETTLLETRESALFEAHTHENHDDHAHAEDDHDHDHAEDHAHDDHDHENEEEHAHDDHGHEGEEEHVDADHDHAHGLHDPHAWLSPTNAATWLNLIAAELSAADPDNAGAYFANAAAGRTELEALQTEVTETLAPVRGQSFIVFHDAFQYFETDFEFPASGAISLSDATDPSPARIAEIQGRIRDEGVTCILAEPQFNANLVATVLDGTEAKTGIIDPIGVDLAPGPELYPSLIRNIAKTLADCL